VTNGRRRKNTIFSLEDGGNHITGDDNLIKHATEFYKNLFDPEDGNVFMEWGWFCDRRRKYGKDKTFCRRGNKEGPFIMEKTRLLGQMSSLLNSINVTGIL
jgi:hypothetical protein